MDISSIFKINIPSSQNVTKFNFNSQNESDLFNFSFWYFNNRWNCIVTLPTGVKRSVGIFKNNMNFLQVSGDYSIFVVFKEEKENIGFEDINKIIMVVIKWQ